MSIARFAAAAAILSSLLLAACESGLPNPYRTVTGWMAAPEGRVLGSMSMVDVAPDGTLWIAERCGANDCLPAVDLDPILHVGADGEWLGAFGAGLFAWPHGVYVDAGGNVWVTDARGGEDRGHQVIKFAPDGRELLRLGTSAHAGDGPTHFNGPTDVVVAPNGDVFVSDGHEPVSNNRIVKFAADGRYLKEWGGTGSAPGQFLVPHALALDSQGRLFVADRDNNRIQIFDQDGELLGRVDAVRPAERHSHRGRRHALRLGQPIERGTPSGLAARPLRRQREGRLGQRVHSGPGVRPKAHARDRCARPCRRRRAARSTAPRSIR